MDMEPVEAEQTSYLAGVLLFLEFYHAVTHACVLFRVRLLPNKDLVRQRYYFLADTMTVALTNFVFTGKLRWLAAIQMVQHLFFFFTWNKHPYTKRVASWSSLDWSFSKLARFWHWDLVLGTLFDLTVHVINSYLLMLYTSSLVAGICMSTALFFAILVLYNPKFAWGSPGNIPKWVKKRIGPVSEEVISWTSAFNIKLLFK